MTRPEYVAGRSPWTRLTVVGIWAVAYALVEAMGVFCLRRLFALEYAVVFTSSSLHFPESYLAYEQAREAATVVMLVSCGFIAAAILVLRRAKGA